MSDPVFLDVEDVLLLHEEQLEQYGGSAGVRDTGLLESGVAVPRATAGGALAHEDLFAMAAAYAFHIAQNQPSSTETSGRACSPLSSSST